MVYNKENMNLSNNFFIFLFFMQLTGAVVRTDKPLCVKQKCRLLVSVLNKKNVVVQTNRLFKAKKGKPKGRPYFLGRPGGNGWHNPLGDLPYQNGNNGHNNNSLSWLIDITPVAMAMYCFNNAPRLTMVVLTSLLLYIAGSNDDE